MHTPSNTYPSDEKTHTYEYPLFTVPVTGKPNKQNGMAHIHISPLGISFDAQLQHHSDISHYFTHQQEKSHYVQPEGEQPMPVPKAGKPHGLIHPDGQEMACAPSLSPPLSPESLASSCVTPVSFSHATPVAVPAHTKQSSPKRNIVRSKSFLRRTPSLNTSPVVSSDSWSHLQSPAASFLAQFAAPQQNTEILEEQEGDEIDDYVLEDVIGYGGFGTVRRAYSISTGQRVAIKIIRKSLLTESVNQHRLERELTIWRSLSHDNIVQVHKILDTDQATYIVCDYCQGGNLLEQLNGLGTAMNEDTVRPLFKSIAGAVHYLHNTAKVCHKDLKLENILLDQSGAVKLCDFGLAVHQQPLAADSLMSPAEEKGLGVAGGSLAYASPEQIQSPFELSCPKTDIWSLGVILLTMVCGRHPFSDQYDVRLRQKILNADYDLPSFLSSPLKRLIQGCLEVNPKHRYSIDQVLASPWLS